MPECLTSYDCCPESDFAYEVVPDTGQFLLTIVVEPEEGGTVTGDGLHDEFENVTVTATPDGGYSFVGWYDENDVLLSEDASYTFQLTSNLIITALFAL